MNASSSSADSHELFHPLQEQVLRVQLQIGATAAAVYVLQGERVACEWYSGRHGASDSSRRVDERSQFNVASIRKTYLGLAISLLMEDGLIDSLEREIGDYLEDCGPAASGVTLRHLLTHTHGLIERDGELAREFRPGEGWAYRNAGVNLLIRLVALLSGLTLSELLQRRVFDVCGLRETGWRTKRGEHLIYNYYDDANPWVGPNDSGAGDQGNLFASARDLARWGYLHLRRGRVNGEQSIPATVFGRVAERLTPALVPEELPRNGFVWWLQHDTPLNQLGSRLPSRSYQALGLTGCACLVVPELDAVVVRMLNQLGPAADYDYLADIRAFGDLACSILEAGT